MFEISAKSRLCDVILGIEEKTSDLAAYSSRNSGAAITVLFTIQTFNEHSRLAKLSQPYLRGHMRCNVSRLCFLCLSNRESLLWTPVNFEVEYFLNEETEGVLTDTVIYFYD